MTSHPRHHPSDATLMCYAAGSLGQAASMVVKRHLDLCPRCAATVCLAEQMGAALISGMPSDALLDGALDGALALIADPVASPQHATQNDLDLRPVGMRWASILPQNKYRVIKKQGKEVLRLAIYGTDGLPLHGHQGLELLLVLEGRLTDDKDEYGVGDVCEADQETEHSMRAVQGSCMCLVAAEGRLIYRNLGSRIRQRFFGI